jgi:hypothetical protein
MERVKIEVVKKPGPGMLPVNQIRKANPMVDRTE